MKAACVSATATLLTLGLLGAASAPARLPAESYQVDPIHSTLVFRAKHLGVSYFYGRFNGIAGNFIIDEDPAKCSFQVQVQSEAIDTANAKRDQHLKSPDFFNAKQFPVISFKSTRVKGLPDGTYEVTGDLALHGVTRPVAVKVVKTGSGRDPRGRTLAGLEATFGIKRSEFGMTYMLEGLSDDVQVTVSLEGARQ